MNVLVVDAGGRGNAIAHAFSRSKKVKKVFVGPGNAGSEFFEKCKQASISSIRDLEGIVNFSKENADLVFVGPEEPLSLGLIDRLNEEGIPAIGPEKEATILEASKCWTKDFLKQIGVPIPEYRNFENADEAKEYVVDYYKSNRGNLVVKADGLAAGKGVFVCDSMDEALFAVEEIMVKRKFGDAGKRIVIEERLYGIEVAFTAVSDGRTVKAFGHAKDFKRAFDADDIDGMRNFNIALTKRFISKSDAEKLFREGKLINPNTGGMGAISPHPALNEEIEKEIMDMVVEPIIKKFKELRTEFKGVLYPVIMLEREADELVPKVLEINVRECDPGAQAKLPRLETDIFDVSTAILDGELKDLEIKFSNNCCVAVCAVSGALKGREGLKPGYPADHYTNQPIKGIDEAMNHAILYANGISKADSYRTTGGRVITVVGCDLTFDGARSKAYSAIERIKFPGMKYRRTIEPNTPE